MVTYRDAFTEWMGERMDEWTEKIYDIEDGLSSLEENEEDIINYLKNIACSNPLGMALRRYICAKFGTKSSDDSFYTLNLPNEKTLKVSPFIREDYDIINDDITEYVEALLDINAFYNTDKSGNLILDITKAEARRMLRVDTSCTREKMFLLSLLLFAKCRIR